MKSTLKNVRISPRKLGLVVKMLKKDKTKQVDKVSILLKFINRKSTYIFREVLMSAVANAKKENNIDSENLVIKEINLGPGKTMKRHYPGSRGSPKPIKKRTSNLTILLKSIENVKDSMQKKSDESVTDSTEDKGGING